MRIITRKEAKAKGLKKYFTGYPCKNNHVSERRTSNCECISCEKARKAKKGIKRTIRVVTFAGDRRTRYPVFFSDNRIQI